MNLPFAEMSAAPICKPTAYEIRVKTSDIFGGGTDAAVKIRLTDSQGREETFHLSTGAQLYFKPNSMEIFHYNRIPPMSDLVSAMVWHDNTGGSPAWHLEYVEVSHYAKGRRYRFNCGKWLSTADGDCQLWRQLKCSGVEPIPHSECRCQPAPEPTFSGYHWGEKSD